MNSATYTAFGKKTYKANRHTEGLKKLRKQESTCFRSFFTAKEQSLLPRLPDPTRSGIHKTHKNCIFYSVMFIK